MLKCLLILQLMVALGVFALPRQFHIDMKHTEVDVCGFRQYPHLIQRSPEGRPVYGVQPIGAEIYVIRDSTSYIEDYRRQTFKLIRKWSIENLQGPYDMVQSRYGQASASLFIADWFNAVNLTVVKVPSGPVTQWSFKENDLTTLGLTGSSLYTGANILVTSAVSQKIKEFTPDGGLVREVTIQNISRPRQSIKVANNRYAVCHGYGPPPELHRVCLVNETGHTIKCHGGDKGSGKCLLNVPARLELNKKNCILVADSGNKRVVLLSQDLEYVRDLINENLEGPYRLYLDEKQSLLYVADNKVNASGIAISGRVLVFKI